MYMDMAEVFKGRWDLLKIRHSQRQLAEFYKQVCATLHYDDAQKVLDYVGEDKVQEMQRAFQIAG